MPQNFLLTRALLSVALLGSLWVRVTLARSPALSGSKLLSLWQSLALYGHIWLSLSPLGSLWLLSALISSYQALARIAKVISALQRCIKPWLQFFTWEPGFQKEAGLKHSA